MSESELIAIQIHPETLQRLAELAQIWNITPDQAIERMITDSWIAYERQT